MKSFTGKNPLEKVPLTFDFGLPLATGETLTGTPVVAVSVHSGTDASPAGLLNGAASLDASSKKVIVPVQAGVDGVVYRIDVSCNTTNASKVLALSALLPVKR